MKKGQALIETLVAVSVLTIGFLGLVSLLSQSLSLNRVVADNYIATYLAAEGIEVVKNILDSKSLSGTWGIPNGVYEADFRSSELVPDQNRFLRYDSTSQLYDYSGTEGDTRFRRKIEIESRGQDEIIVKSRISWITRGGGDFSLDLEDHFFNWKKYAD